MNVNSGHNEHLLRINLNNQYLENLTNHYTLIIQYLCFEINTETLIDLINTHLMLY